MKKTMLRVVLTSVLMSVMLFTATVNAYHPEETSSDVDTVTDTAVFTDVEKTDENYDAIKYLKSSEVVVGYSDGSYKPDDTINRAEFLKIVMEAYGYDVEGYGDCFPDVNDQWFAPHICKAEDMGIVDGYDNGYFMPDWQINFAEASKIVAEAFRLTADTSDSDTWFQQYVVSLELLAAIPTSVDSFGKNITRGEMAEMVYRIKAQKTTKASNTYDSIKAGETTSVGDGDVTNITLIDKGDGNVKWVSDGYSDSGFKVVWGMTSGPTYPTRSSDQYKYHSDPSTYLSEVSAFDGEGTYYVRVCEYLGGSCGVYSNEIEVVLGAEAAAETGDVTGITLTDAGDLTVSWDTAGYSDQGYKVVWSKTSEPVYPNRAGDEYLYYSDPTVDSAELNAFDGDGTYYVRVCEYLGGSCGLYSNEITMNLGGSTPSGAVTSLTLVNNFDGSVDWIVNGTSADGYKVVWSKTAEPVYPNRASDEYLYYSDPAVSTADLTAFDGDGTYYVRVCEYVGSACGVYSNEISVNLTDAINHDVSLITMSDDGGGAISWTVEGYSEEGFKVVWSKNAGATYPSRTDDEYIYHSDPSTVASDVYAFDGDGSYYVRVCEYTGGACGVYSDELEIELLQ
jgi:S-layer homology domain